MYVSYKSVSEMVVSQNIHIYRIIGHWQIVLPNHYANLLSPSIYEITYVISKEINKIKKKRL